MKRCCIETEPNKNVSFEVMPVESKKPSFLKLVYIIETKLVKTNCIGVEKYF